MKKIFGSLFLRILAFVTVCIAAPILCISLFCAAETYDADLYHRAVTYEETSICRNFVNENLAEVREFIYWNDLSEFKKYDYYRKHENFAVVIYDEKGEIAYSTLRDSSNFTLIVDDYPAKEVDSEGKTLETYSMKGYVAKVITDSYDGFDDYTRYAFYKENRFVFLQSAAVCFIICSVLCIYLIAVAGSDKDGNIELWGLCAIDYDILMAFAIAGFVFLANLFGHIRYQYDDVFKLAYMLIILAGLTAVVLVALISTSAHLKTRRWWEHTFIYQFFSVFGGFFRWLISNIGITWKLALGVLAYSFVVYFLGFLTIESHDGAIFLLLAIFVTVAAICIAIWFGSQLKKIRRGGEAIAKGDFDYRINSRELWPSLRGHAYNLNCAALGMSKAVDDRLKSERFKTELITNVSHDLKTPLTSIVSYVDLLKKEQIENETALGYIEVIDRQSAKLKKLTEDLVEASKASSGAVAVNKTLVNICELINQSVGEFSEKLETADIVPVVNLPENEVCVQTDGRLLWRVFDNLIQNIIKYAQPGTRAYFDLAEAENNAVLTIRNISREPLNMSAESLMERFVRGDSSRNSEGNGLGLSIAKSLTELCGGTFDLQLDGDLYKVTLTIPLAKE